MNFGPVQPFGVTIRIIGHGLRSRSPSSRAARWISRIRASTVSMVAAMVSCRICGSSPSTVNTSWPKPVSRASSSSRWMRAGIVGLAIL